MKNIIPIILIIAVSQACTNTTSTSIPPILTPTVTATSIVTATPTPIVSKQSTTEKYMHNRFSINYPHTWKQFKRPDGAIFIEPSNNAGYSVVFTDVGQKYTEQELNQYLVTFVAQNFLEEGANFKAISQEQQPDGSIVAQFSSVDPDLGSTINEIRVLQDGTTVFVIHLNITKEQWPSSATNLQTIVDSFTPLDTSPVIEQQATLTPPNWALIGPENKSFGFLYADNWEILEQTSTLITVRNADINLTFTANQLNWPDAKTDPHAAKKAALAYIADILLSKYDDVQSLPPTEFPLDNVTGATIDFVYTNKNGTLMAGSVITAVNGGKMHRIIFTAPANFYDAALQWFNPMYKSFKFLDANDISEIEP